MTIKDIQDLVAAHQAKGNSKSGSTEERIARLKSVTVNLDGCDNLKKELSEVLWEVAGIANSLQIDLIETFIENFETNKN